MKELKPKYLAFDLETGGLNPKTNAILTGYWGVYNKDFELLDELELFVKPLPPFDLVEASALKVNQIDIQKHIEDPKTVGYADAVGLLTVFLAKHKGSGRYDKPRPIGHNVDFDLDFIYNQFMDKTTWEKYCSYGKIDTKGIADFLKDVGWLPPEIGRLESLVKHFNLPQLKAHTAKDDTHMMINVYKQLISMLQSSKSGGITSLDLLQMLEK